MCSNIMFTMRLCDYCEKIASCKGGGSYRNLVACNIDSLETCLAVLKPGCVKLISGAAAAATRHATNWGGDGRRTVPADSLKKAQNGQAARISESISCVCIITVSFPGISLSLFISKSASHIGSTTIGMA